MTFYIFTRFTHKHTHTHTRTDPYTVHGVRTHFRNDNGYFLSHFFSFLLLFLSWSFGDFGGGDGGSGGIKNDSNEFARGWVCLGVRQWQWFTVWKCAQQVLSEVKTNWRMSRDRLCRRQRRRRRRKNNNNNRCSKRRARWTQAWNISCTEMFICLRNEVKLFWAPMLSRDTNETYSVRLNDFLPTILSEILLFSFFFFCCLFHLFHFMTVNSSKGWQMKKKNICFDCHENPFGEAELVHEWALPFGS